MEIIMARSAKGTGTLNEDAYGSAGNKAWVLDGATNVFRPGSGDVYWYVNRLNAAIGRAAEADPSAGLCSTLSAAIGSIFREAAAMTGGSPSAPEYMRPTYAIAMVMEREGGFDYLIMGDSSVFWYGAGEGAAEWGILTDRRTDSFHEHNVRMIAAIPGGPGREARITRVYQETRTNANRPHGYAIGSIFPGCAERAVTGHVPFQSGSGRALLFTDGLRGYDMKKKGGALLSGGEKADLALSSFREGVMEKQGGCDDITALLVGMGNRSDGGEKIGRKAQAEVMRPGPAAGYVMMEWRDGTG